MTPPDASTSVRSDVTARSMNISVIHPTVALCGGDRLMVDACWELGRRGHHVSMLTNDVDRHTTFPEALDGPFTINVAGAFLPHHLRERARAACTITRMAWLAARARLQRPPADVHFLDVASHVVPLLALTGRAPVAFYCHYPDVLSREVRGALHALYRRPIDGLEAHGLRQSALVMVNSAYTASVFTRAFPQLPPPTVVYPGVHIPPARVAIPEDGPRTISFIGRYHVEKNGVLAVDAVARLMERTGRRDVELVVAGGWSEDFVECAIALEQMEQRARARGISGHVRFLKSISEDARLALLERSTCLLHTNLNEHFGIAPVEAMALGRPVVGVALAGLLETVEDGRTGRLAPPDEDALAQALEQVVFNVPRARELGAAARARAIEHFSREAFGARVESLLWGLTEGTFAGRH